MKRMASIEIWKQDNGKLLALPNILSKDFSQKKQLQEAVREITENLNREDSKR